MEKLYYLCTLYGKKWVNERAIVANSQKEVYQLLLDTFKELKLRRVYAEFSRESRQLSEEQLNFDLNHIGTTESADTSILLLGDLFTIYCKDRMKFSSELTTEDVRVAFKQYSFSIGIKVVCDDRAVFVGRNNTLLE